MNIEIRIEPDVKGKILKMISEGKMSSEMSKER